MIRKILHHPFFIRLLHWEYWPFHLVYAPLYPFWLWLCLRSKSFFFFSTSNPSIKNAGFLMEPKHEIYSLLPENSYPGTIYFKTGTPASVILGKIKERGLPYPLIGKPDIGMKGRSVKKLENEAALLEYAMQSKVPFLVQSFVPFTKEAGIFYYRYPGEEKGQVSGIVSKEFLSVKGDGYSTILELLQKDKRHLLQVPTLRKTFGKQLQTVLPAGEEFVLVPYGNHVRGAKFIDSSHLADGQLEHIIDSICRHIPGFYFGRLDIRYRSWEELKRGEHFSIIELNGAGSEPTHIYDPRHSIFFAWKEIIRHWKILWTISRINHKKNSIPYMDTRTGLKMLRENSRYVKLIS